MKPTMKWNPNKLRYGHKLLTSTGVPLEILEMHHDSTPPHRGQGVAKTFEGESLRFSTADGEVWDNGNLRRKPTEKVYLVLGTGEEARAKWSRLFIAEERKNKRAALPPPLKLYLAKTETSDTCLVTAKNLTAAHKELESWAMCEATSMRLIGNALPRRKAGVVYV
jgi:hypothetical protein